MAEVRTISHGKIVGVKTSIFTIMDQEKYDPKAIPTAWREFFSKLPKAGLPNSEVFYGASIPSMDMNIPMTYIAGQLIESDSDVESELESVDISSGKYFCYTHTGPISELAKSYGIAYGIELPQSGHQMRNAPHLEIYEGFRDPMSSDYEMTIAIPIA